MRALEEKDYIGKKYNLLTVIRKTEERDTHNRILWEFKCDCGEIVKAYLPFVKNGNNKSCGCLNKQRKIERNMESSSIKIGDKYGKLTVIENLGLFLYSNKHRRTKYKCLCECGNFCEAWSFQLTTKKKQSCGCLSSIGELMIKNILDSNNIIYNREVVLKELVKETGRRLRFDFIIYNDDNTINRIIEYDGRQHVYGPDTDYWSKTNDTLESIKEKDELKNNFCKKHNYKLIRIPYWIKNITLEDLFNDRFSI